MSALEAQFADAVAAYAAERGITEILHFTTNNGALGILARACSWCGRYRIAIAGVPQAKGAVGTEGKDEAPVRAEHALGLLHRGAVVGDRA